MESCDKQNEHDFGHHTIPSLVRSAHIRAYDFRNGAKDVPRYWRDIGTLDSYYEASMDLVRPETPFDPYANEDWPSYPARYDSSWPMRSLDCRARKGLHSHRLIARMRTNCRISRSILSPGVRVEDGGLIECSVLMAAYGSEKTRAFVMPLLKKVSIFPPVFKSASI